MNPLIPSRSAALSLLCIALLASFLAGWYEGGRFNEPDHIASTPHPQIRQQDGSLIAARLAAPQAPQQIVPHGDRVLATGHVQLAATAPVAASGVQVEPVADSGSMLFADNGDGSYRASPHLLEVCQRLMSCPAAQLDETLVVDKHGQEDLIVSSPTGTVEAAQVGFAPVEVAKVHPWMIGPSHGAGRWGLVAAYSFTRLPITVGAQAEQGSERVFVGWRF